MSTNRKTGKRLRATIIGMILALSFGVLAFASNANALESGPVVVVRGGEERLESSQAGDTLTFTAADGLYGFSSKDDVKVYLNGTLLGLSNDEQIFHKGKVVKTTITLQQGSYKVIVTNKNGGETIITFTVS